MVCPVALRLFTPFLSEHLHRPGNWFQQAEGDVSPGDVLPAAVFVKIFIPGIQAYWRSGFLTGDWCQVNL